MSHSFPLSVARFRLPWLILLFLCFGVSSFCNTLTSAYSSVSPDSGKVYRIVDEMPRFPGCEHLDRIEAKKNCADEALIKYINAHIQYPE